MCRRCGESDRRGKARDRRARRAWLASADSGHGGDGINVQCWNWAECGAVLCVDDRYGRVCRLEVDRIVPGWQCVVCRESVCHHARKRHPFEGGGYRRSNIRPSCGSCNRARNRESPWQLGEESRCLTG